MMKDMLLQQQQQQHPSPTAENMSNLTSASGEAILSSSSHQSTTTSQTAPPSMKRKRSLPGNPDPDAEVIALSPKTLMATNRFICEICNKGFQRDQNLQLHRRGHNLPWKLKQRSSQEVKKKVYVCPEVGCVHHEPSRALGDLTGIKKHFCRKHGEKKWKCEKCSKRYAVQSDWKAHSKTCGTREYRCDCGTLFSRRDSFITHRAFCDALAEESARSISGNPLLSSSHQLPLQSQFNNHHHDFHQTISSIKTDQHHQQQQQHENFNLRPEIPSWLSFPPPPNIDHLSSSSSSMFPTRFDQDFSHTQTSIHHDNPETDNQGSNITLNLPPYQAASVSSPHMSATALLQKAAQMGATISKPSSSSTSATMVMNSISRGPHHQAHMCNDNNTTAAAAAAGNPSTTSVTTTGTGFGLGLSSHDEEIENGNFVHGLTTFGNNKADSTVGSDGFMDHHTSPAATSARAASGGGEGPHPSLFQDMITSLSSASGFAGSSFNQAFGGGGDGGILNSNSKSLEYGKNPSEFNFQESTTTTSTVPRNHGSGNNDGMTRDFLGLRAFSHTDILNMAGFHNQCMSTSSSHHQNEQQQQQNRKPWQ